MLKRIHPRIKLIYLNVSLNHPRDLPPHAQESQDDMSWKKNPLASFFDIGETLACSKYSVRFPLVAPLLY